MFYHANNYFRKSNEFSLNLPIENGAWNKEIQVKFLCYGDIIIPEKLHFRIWLCYNCDRNEDNKKKREKKGDRLCQRHDFVTGVAVYHSRCYCFFPVRQLFYSTRTLKNGKNRPDLLETFFALFLSALLPSFRQPAVCFFILFHPDFKSHFDQYTTMEEQTKKRTGRWHAEYTEIKIDDRNGEIYAFIIWF